MEEHPRGSIASIISGANSRSTTGATFQTAAAMERPERPRPTEAAPSGFHVLTVPPAGAQASPARVPRSRAFDIVSLSSGGPVPADRGLRADRPPPLARLDLVELRLHIAAACGERQQRAVPLPWATGVATRSPAARAGRAATGDRPTLVPHVCVCSLFGGAPRRAGRTRSGRVPRRRSCGDRKRQSSTARCVRALVGSR